MIDPCMRAAVAPTLPELQEQLRELASAGFVWPVGGIGTHVLDNGMVVLTYLVQMVRKPDHAQIGVPSPP